MESVVTSLVFKGVLLVLLLVAAYFIVKRLKKSVSGIKGMLLGINITLFGGVVALDPHSNIGGGYIIALIGIILSFKCAIAND
ncbi:hypothetical protein [Clostridium manihotivorum]|uniref:Uncharacterized protein n=1 Tax=Clostridium manihotivorum TaxID=2320868 RepID=A0A3R5UH55_9CLOT|nr:hypothetical protein [Clostridium manihotivorum]QAA33601.1 hypothetical protein C1I91_19250 [Clostridium manihotivorum]